jgi:hypothetical protein
MTARSMVTATKIIAYFARRWLALLDFGLGIIRIFVVSQAEEKKARLFPKKKRCVVTALDEYLLLFVDSFFKFFYIHTNSLEPCFSCFNNLIYNNSSNTRSTL